MDLKYIEFKKEEKDFLIDFLTSDIWEYHSDPIIDRSKIEERIEQDYYSSNKSKTFWIINEWNLRIGIVHVFDLVESNPDETPLFDIRIKREFRDRGIGTKAVRWLIAHLFSNYPLLNRIEATTRQDNIAMRKILKKCGFVKEAHYREAWPAKDNIRFDCIGYGILKKDWMDKKKTSVNWNDEEEL